MEEISNALADIIRWGVPVTGILFMFLAWKRFQSSGARLAFAGFVVILISPLVRIGLRQVLDSGLGFSARDLSLISTVGAVFSLAGVAVVAFAMRRLIASAETTASPDPAPGDRQ